MSPFSFAYSQKLLFRILGDESICAQMIVEDDRIILQKIKDD